MVWQPGRSIQGGRYTIQDVLGQGGFGITYRVLHVRLRQPRVIKTPNLHLRHDPEYQTYVDRFIQEGQRLAELTADPHPHIVRAWDLFEEGDIPCLVMDFVPGETLSQRVRQQGALPEVEIVLYICQIGEALSFIHRAGLVHRDAHPSNVIIRPDRKAILIDFGIAKDLIPSTQSTLGRAGNLKFAPYEQLAGGSRKPTVDIYCLAATLYFAATGECPMSSIERKLRNAALIVPKQANPRISDRLNQGILRGMALEAGDRPQTMQEWLQTIAPLETLPRVTPSIAPPDRSPTPPKSKLPTTKRRRQPKQVPWGWLTCITSCYFISGGLLGFTSISVISSFFGAVTVFLAVSWAFIVATTVAMAAVNTAAGVWALATGVAWALAVAVAIFLAWVVTVSSPETVAGNMASAGSMAALVAVGGTWVIAGVMVRVGEKLLESFNSRQTFIVLSGVAVIGLGLGWAIGFAARSSIFHTVGML